MKNVLLGVLFGLGVIAVSASAEVVKKDPREIAEVKFGEVVPTDEELFLSQETFDQNFRTTTLGDGLDDAGVYIDKLIMIGQKVVDIVKAGAPVIDVKNDAVHVVPQGINAWQALAGWKTPVTKVYALSMKNGFGMTVIQIRLKLSATGGGNYDGQGKYLSNVYMVPTSLYSMWGFYLNVWMENRPPVNVGTKSSPTAGLGVDLRYKVSSALPITAVTGAQDYFVTGDGSLQAL